jgi:hypothetical protein
MDRWFNERIDRPRPFPSTNHRVGVRVAGLVAMQTLTCSSCESGKFRSCVA